MDLEKVIKKGLVHEDSFQVAEEHSAIQVGSGGSQVLATPWLIAFMERVGTSGGTIQCRGFSRCSPHGSNPDRQYSARAR
jgi:hypothetical protein